MVEAGARSELFLALVNPGDPFELDPESNLPHLMTDPELGPEDALDAFLFGEPIFYEDDSDGSADWLMVAEIPGQIIVVVPLAPSKHSGLSKVRPITILRAPDHVIAQYREDRGW